MSLDKAIQYGKEHRKPYRGAKAIDCTCRNNGTCEHCKNNRLHQANKEKSRLSIKEKEYNKEANYE